MKALTIWQPWASLIIIGAKPIEWRKRYAPRTVIGQRIAIHAGARKVEKIEVAALIHDCLREGRQLLAGKPVVHPTGFDIAKALPLLSAAMADPDSLPRSALIGTAMLGEPQLAQDLGFPVDSRRLEHQNWGWPLSTIEVFDAPRPMKGAQGFWNVREADDVVARFVEAL